MNGISFIIKGCDFIRMHMSSLVFEVFAHLFSIAPLALLVLLYYIHMRLEDRQARGHRYPIQDTNLRNEANSIQETDPENHFYAIPQQPCDDG